MDKLSKQEQKRKWNREWIQKNRERYNASKYFYREKLKYEVLAHYSKGIPVCSKCGTTNINFLCLDHINNDGAKDRRENIVASRSGYGQNSYENTKKRGYPVGLQVLCANCNLEKEILRKRINKLNNKFYVPFDPTTLV